MNRFISATLIALLFSTSCVPAVTMHESHLPGPRKEYVDTPSIDARASSITIKQDLSNYSDVPEKAPAAASSSQVPALQTPPGRVTPIQQRTPAPFSGVLFSPEAVAWMLAQQEAHLERIRIERQDATDIAGAVCERRVADLESRSEADRDTMQAQLDSQQQEIEVYHQQIEELEKKGTGPSPLLWGGLGVVGGVVVTLGVVFIVNSASK